MTEWFKTDFKGVRYRKHPTRKHGVQFDHYYVITYKYNGKTHTEALGWASEGNKPSDAFDKLCKLKRNQKAGKGPCTLSEMRAQAEAVKQAERQEAVRHDVMVADAWDAYIEARRSKWSARHLADHLALADAGDRKKKRGKGKIMAGPLAQLMPLKLAELTPEHVEAWATAEAKKRETRTRLSFSLLRAFINWTAGHPEYKGIVLADACSNRIRRETFSKKRAKDDCLQKEQLEAWFSAVRGLSNPVVSAYLQTLLLTGARREELAGLKWTDLDFKWNAITIHDKVDGERTIPLTPYVSSLLAHLPRRNAYVFSSPAAKSGRLQEPRHPHNRAIAVAGIEALTIHGLRRSFGTLSEWVEVPAGVVAQLMGHKPSATAEKHYRRRPLDLLRVWHEKIEAWIIEQAGIAQPGGSSKVIQLTKN